MKISQKIAALLAGCSVMFAGIGAGEAQAKPLSNHSDRGASNLLLAQDSEQKPEAEESDMQKPEAEESDKQKPEQYTFTLTNKTKQAIIVVAAADATGGESMGTFDLENGRIEPGDTVTLVWDQSTNNTGCEWAITVGFEDESVAEPAIVNFCDDEVNLTVK